jgi:hypothetical protein
LQRPEEVKKASTERIRLLIFEAIELFGGSPGTLRPVFFVESGDPQKNQSQSGESRRTP